MECFVCFAGARKQVRRSLLKDEELQSSPLTRLNSSLECRILTPDEGQPITTLRLRTRRKNQMTPAAAPKSPEVDLDDSDVDADFRLDVVGSASSSSSSSEDAESDKEHDTIAMKSRRRGRKTPNKTAQVTSAFKYRPLLLALSRTA